MTLMQLRLYRFIERYIAKKGYSPSYEEMRAGVGIGSKSNVARLLDALEERGRIRRHRDRARSIELIPEATLLDHATIDQCIARIHALGGNVQFIIGGQMG